MLHTCAKSIFPSRDSQSLTPNESTRFPPASLRFDASWVSCCEASHLGAQRYEVRTARAPLVGTVAPVTLPPPPGHAALRRWALTTRKRPVQYAEPQGA